MKTIVLILFAGILYSACNGQKESSQKAEKKEYAFTMPQDSIEKATAIVWIDKYSKKNNDIQFTRKVKAKVNIDLEGKIEVIAYVKDYPQEVQKYINHKLVDFRAPKLIMENYIKPGVQFVQLRYTPSVIAEKYKFLK